MERLLENQELNEFLKRGNLYDELPCGFVSFSPEGSIYDVNRTLADWLGRTPEELVSVSFKSMLSKASLLYYNLFLDPLLRVKNSTEEISLQFVGLDGSFDVLFSAKSYRDSGGTTILINAIVLKIDNRKKYEAELLLERRNAEAQQSKLQFLIDLVPIQIWTTNSEGRVLSINRQVGDYFGDLSLDNRSDFSGMFSEDREAAYADWLKSIAVGKRYEREARFVGTSGKPEWFLIQCEPFYSPDNKIEIWFCCSININKKKLLQLANQQELKTNLSRAYQTLDHNEARFSSLAMSQSHMVRKPLANILGLIEIINEKPEEEELLSILSMLYESVQELDLMVKKVSKDML
ncbi:MAG: PAS domain-containing protein [Pedobacter sp.]